MWLILTANIKFDRSKSHAVLSHHAQPKNPVLRIPRTPLPNSPFLRCRQNLALLVGTQRIAPLKRPRSPRSAAYDNPAITHVPKARGASRDWPRGSSPNLNWRMYKTSVTPPSLWTANFAQRTYSTQTRLSWNTLARRR